MSTIMLKGGQVCDDVMKDVNDAFSVLRVQPNICGGASKILVPLIEITTDASGQLAIHCRSGLAAAVRGYLLLRGVEFHGVHPAPKPRYFQREVVSRNPQILEFLNSVERGRVLVHRRECSLADAVAEILSGLPHSKIVVVVDDNAPQFRAILRPLVQRIVSLATSQNFDSGGPDVVVSTGKSFGRTGLREAGVVVVVDPLITDKDDPMFASYSEPEDISEYCPKLDKLGDVTGKLIAVLDAEAKYSPWESARLSQVFGSNSVRVLSDNTDPKTRAYPREASILWGWVKSANGLGNVNDPFAIKVAVWKNRGHNRQVAQLSKALATGDMGAVGGILRQVPTEWVMGRPLRVVVYVGSLDHAESLSPKLPNWTINTALSETSMPGCGVIVTEMGAGVVDSAAIDIVIRADSGVGMPNALLEWAKTPFPFNPPLYVVDFAARGGALLRKWLQSRREAYLDANWPEYGIHPDVHAFKVFRRGVTRRGHR
jgi:hypothetical protein